MMGAPPGRPDISKGSKVRRRGVKGGFTRGWRAFRRPSFDHLLRGVLDAVLAPGLSGQTSTTVVRCAQVWYYPKIAFALFSFLGLVDWDAPWVYSDNGALFCDWIEIGVVPRCGGTNKRRAAPERSSAHTASEL